MVDRGLASTVVAGHLLEPVVWIINSSLFREKAITAKEDEPYCS